MKRTTRVISCITIVCVAAAGLVAWCLFNVVERTNRKMALSHAERQVSRSRMSEFGWSIQSYVVRLKKRPLGNVKEIISKLENVGGFKYSGVPNSGSDFGMDAWGSFLNVEYRNNKNDNCVIIISSGPNRVFEAGGGDDLQCEVWLPSDKELGKF